MSPVFLGIVGARIAAAIAKHFGLTSSRGGNGVVGTWAVLVWSVLSPIAAALVLFVLAGQVYFLVPLAAILVIMFPWPLARVVLIPLGLVRPAYYLTLTSDIAFHRDRRGGAAVAGAWALAMRPSLDEQDASFLAAELAVQAPLGGAGVLAAGLLLAARGDRGGARALLSLVEGIDARVCPAAAKRLANAWLASDAAEQGEWLRVSELGLTPLRGGRLGWLLSAIGQSLLLEPMAPGKLGLWLRWTVTPHRRRTLPMVRRALDALDGAFIEPEEEPPLTPIVSAQGEGELPAALSLHASLLLRPAEALRPDDVRAVGKAWDAVIESRADERILQARARALGASGAGATLERLRASIEEDIAAAVLASGIRLTELSSQGPVASRVRARLRDRMLSEVELASDAIRRRVDDKREIGAADEWREWANLTVLYERGVESAGDDFRRLAFVKVYPDASSYAVWLFNDRKQRPLGNAIFRWLLVEAEALDDQRAITLQARNVACGV